MTNQPALATQVGGDHYKSMAIQPVEFALVNELNTAQANILKYVCRHASKDGARDLKKAIHYCDLWLDVFAVRGIARIGWGVEGRRDASLHCIAVDTFIDANQLDAATSTVVELICISPSRARVKTARAALVGLLHEHYDEVA